MGRATAVVRTGNAVDATQRRKMMSTVPADGRSTPAAPDTLRQDVAAYFVLAISITWFFWIPVVLQRTGALPFSLPGGPMEVLGAAGPLISAVILTARREGGRGVKRLFGRLLEVRFRWYWWLVALAVPFVFHYTPVVIAHAGGLIEASYADFGAPFPIAVLMLLPWLILLSLEEVGWRGFALPRMQEKYSALKAGLLLGVGWGLWHAPFALGRAIAEGSGPPAARLLSVFAFWIVMSLLWTWIFNNTRGSLIIANFFYVFLNASWDWLRVPGDVEWIFEFALPPVVAVVIIALVAWRLGTRSFTADGKKVTWSSLQERKAAGGST
jgi:membrane protease YdiL (CAAX protease family)